MLILIIAKMKLFLPLLLGLVGVEGVLKIFDSLIGKASTRKPAPGVSVEGSQQLITTAIELLRAEILGRQMTTNGRLMIASTHCFYLEGNGWATVALIGDQSSDAAVATFYGIRLMKSECGRGPAPRYMKLENDEWYRIDRVTCKHPYSQLRAPGTGLSRPNDDKIAIMKIDRTREVSKMSDEDRSQLKPTVYNECDELDQ